MTPFHEHGEKNINKKIMQNLFGLNKLLNINNTREIYETTGKLKLLLV